MSYAEAVRRVDDTNRVGQVRAGFINERQLKEGEIFNSDDALVVEGENICKKKKSDVAREITTAAKQLLGFKGIDPKEV